MTTCLGIDPSLNATGYFLYSEEVKDKTFLYHETISPDPGIKSQFQKMVVQRDLFKAVLYRQKPDYLAIEQPFVLPMRSRGAGGEQSSNLWALYCMLLDVAWTERKPIAIFHLAQLRSLIHGRGKTTKDDTINEYSLQLGLIPSKYTSSHEADAYFIAMYGAVFWKIYESSNILWLDLDSKKSEIFLSTDPVSKGRKRGMLWRPGDAWYDFRKHNFLELPTHWRNQIPVGA